MKQSENMNELFKALAIAQGKIQAAVKDSANPFFKSKYTSLDACWSACRVPLSDNGLSIVQTVSEDGGKLVLTIILGHSSGQFISSSTPLSIKSQDSQGVSSAISYARRFTLCAMVGITAQDDDDGEKEMESHPRPNPKPDHNQNGQITLDQADQLNDMIGEDDEYRKSVFNYLKISTFSALPAARYNQVFTAIQKHNEKVKSDEAKNA